MNAMARNAMLVLLGTSSLLALPAQAEKIGVYAGLQAGYSSADTNEDVIEVDNDKAIGIYGGYKFKDWLGAEIGYARLGKFDPDSFFGVDVESGDDYPSVEMNTLYLATTLWGKFYGPLNVYAKLGVHYTESKFDEKDDEGEDLKETSYSFFYEAGLELPITDNVAATLSYQNFRNIDVLEDFTYEDGEEVDWGEAGVDVVSLGVLFNF